MSTRRRIVLGILGAILLVVPMAFGLYFSKGIWTRRYGIKLLDSELIWPIVLPLSGVGLVMLLAALLWKPMQPKFRDSLAPAASPFGDDEPPAAAAPKPAANRDANPSKPPASES